MSSVQVDAVLFDLGQVLVGWDPIRAFPGCPREEVDRFFVEAEFARHNHLQDAGRSWAELRAIVAESNPDHVRFVDMYVDNFALTLTGPVPGSEQIVDELLDAGLSLYGLTNWSAETFHHALPAAPAIGKLAGLVVSGEVGLAKPDPAIFALTAERFGLDPRRTVFVDDSQANVTAAAGCGFRAVLFTTADAFRAELVALGVLPAAPVVAADEVGRSGRVGSPS